MVSDNFRHRYTPETIEAVFQMVPPQKQTGLDIGSSCFLTPLSSSLRHLLNRLEQKRNINRFPEVRVHPTLHGPLYIA